MCGKGERLDTRSRVACHRVGSDAGTVTSWPHRLISPELIGSSRFTQRQQRGGLADRTPDRQNQLVRGHGQVDALSTSLVTNDCAAFELIASWATRGQCVGASRSCGGSGEAAAAVPFDQTVIEPREGMVNQETDGGNREAGS